MLERSPRDSIILDVVDPSSRYRMFFFGKVPALWAGWQTWPESKADQGDWKSNDAFYDDSDIGVFLEEERQPTNYEKPPPPSSTVHAIEIAICRTEISSSDP